MNLATLILAQETATQPAEAAGLTTEGMLVMTLSIMLVLALNAFCMYRILRNPGHPEDPDA